METREEHTPNIGATDRIKRMLDFEATGEVRSTSSKVLESVHGDSRAHFQAASSHIALLLYLHAQCFHHVCSSVQRALSAGRILGWTAKRRMGSVESGCVPAFFITVALAES